MKKRSGIVHLKKQLLKQLLSYKGTRQDHFVLKFPLVIDKHMRIRCIDDSLAENDITICCRRRHRRRHRRRCRCRRCRHIRRCRRRHRRHRRRCRSS